MSSRLRKFAQIDVFSQTPYLGNPVAVVMDAEGMSNDAMQRLASWTNLSETTFILPPSDDRADYRLRIYTPGGELPFAGHPTMGSAHAWLQNGGKPKREGLVVQECGAGLVSLRSNLDSNGANQLSFQAPKTLKTGPLEPELLAEVAAALGIAQEEIIDHQWVDNGPGWVAVQLSSAEAVLALKPDFASNSNLMVGVVGAHGEGDEVDYEVRAFAPKIGVYEDPVTGSLNASVAQWLFRTGAVAKAYRAGQGACLGREGRIDLSMDEFGDVWVGGATQTCITGTVAI